MPLGFLVPAFLLAAAAVALPVYLHLRHRERRTPVRFPSLMFLARLPHRSSDRRRLTHLLLLALRAAAIVLLAVAFARPFLRDEAAAAATRTSRDVVLVADRSMSMGYTGVWTAVRDSARRILSGLVSGDRAALILVDEAAEVAVPLTGDLAGVTAALAAAAPGAGAGRLGAGIRAAVRALVDSASAGGEIFVLSDFQRSSVAGLEGITLPPGARLTPVLVGPDERANAAVIGIEATRRGSDAGGGAEVTARVAWYGTAPRSVRAALHLDGREAATATALMQPNAVTPLRFVISRVPTGELRGLVRLSADALTADDEFRFTLSAEDRTRVRLFAASDARPQELLFLERALRIGRPPRFDVEVRRGGPVSLAGWGRGSASIFVDRVPSSEAERRELAGFLDRGGGAILFAGSRLPNRRTPPAAEDPFPATAGETITRTESPGILGPLDRDHPALAPLEGLESFAGVRFFRYRALTPREGAEVLARLDDGRPALIAGGSQGRRIVVVAAPADGLWSDLTLHPFFLPLLQRLVEHAAGRGAERSWREVGDVLAMPAAASRGARVFGPAGEPLRLEGDSATATVQLRARGFYEVRRDPNAAEPSAVTAVNAPASESDPARVDPREVLLAMQQDSASAGRTEAAALTPADTERRQRVWRAVLLLALVLLAAEVIYANLGPGRRARGTVTT